MSIAPKPTLSAVTRTRRSGAGNGSGFRMTAFTTANIAALAPMPTASVATAIAAKPGCLRSDLTANFRSCINVSIGVSPRALRSGFQEAHHAQAANPEEKWRLPTNRGRAAPLSGRACSIPDITGDRRGTFLPESRLSRPKPRDRAVARALDTWRNDHGFHLRGSAKNSHR